MILAVKIEKYFANFYNIIIVMHGTIQTNKCKSRGTIIEQRDWSESLVYMWQLNIISLFLVKQVFVKNIY